MSLTFIDTNKISHEKLPGSGEFASVLYLHISATNFDWARD